MELEDEFKVEIKLPQKYIDSSMASIKKYSSGIAHLCKGALMLGEEDYEFIVFGMNTIQVTTVVEAMRHFGIEMTHESGKLPDGTRYTYFYADLTGLKEILENGELEGKADM